MNGESQDKQGLLGQAAQSSLKTSGIAYLVGDAALVTAKLMEGDRAGAWGAGMWGFGGLATTLFGNPTAEKQLQLLERKLGGYLNKQGVSIPDHPSMAELAKSGGVLQHIESFLYAYPSELLNAVYAIGAVLTIKGGMKINAETGKRTVPDVVSGALVLAGALSGLLIPERKPDPGRPAQGMLGTLWEKAQEKPLRVSAAFYTANNLPMAWEGFKKMRAGNTSCWPRYLTVASYLLGNGMLALSSRENTTGELHKTNDMLEALMDKSSLVIAAQPPQVQQVLAQNIAGFLAEQPGVQEGAKEIEQAMLARLAEPRDKGVGLWQNAVFSKKDPSWHQHLQPVMKSLLHSKLSAAPSALTPSPMNPLR